jgi:hypothetical protein
MRWEWLTVGVLMLATACGDAEPPRRRVQVEPRAAQPAGPPKLDEAWELRITPTTDGAAYATAGLGGGIWYLKGATATRVKEHTGQ